MGTERLKRFHGFVAVQGRGTVALPPVLRRSYGLDEPGAQVEVTEREDGVFEMRPVLPVPVSQRWFWDERWQAGEREVDEQIGAGEVSTFETLDGFLAHLDSIDPVDPQ